MARKLSEQTNVEVPDSDFPFGRIRNNQGDGLGTPVSESVYGDIHQFFAKAMSEAGVAPNRLPDNEYNGFQLFEAFIKLFFPDGRVIRAVTSDITGWNMNASGAGTAQKSVLHKVANHKKIIGFRVRVSSDDGTTHDTLETAYQPATDRNDLMVRTYGSTLALLNTVVGGVFDTANYSTGGSFVRGTLTTYFEDEIDF